jgi:hypothetical protein
VLFCRQTQVVFWFGCIHLCFQTGVFEWSSPKTRWLSISSVTRCSARLLFNVLQSNTVKVATVLPLSCFPTSEKSSLLFESLHTSPDWPSTWQWSCSTGGENLSQCHFSITDFLCIGQGYNPGCLSHGMAWKITLMWIIFKYSVPNSQNTVCLSYGAFVNVRPERTGFLFWKSY